MKRHLSADEVAAYLEGSLTGHESREVDDHALHCPSCHQWLVAAADAVEIEPELVGAEVAPAIREQLERTVLPPGIAPSRAVPATPRGRQLLPWQLGVASLAAVVLGTLLFWPGTPQELTVPGDTSLLASLERSSAIGLVLPGGQRGAAEVSPAYRSGSTADGNMIPSSTLADLEVAAGTDPLAASWLVSAYLAVDRTEVAAGWLESLQKTHGEAPELQLVAGILAYRESDLEQAERLLRSVPSHSAVKELAQLDLALVLIEAGSRSEAEEILTRLSAESVEPALRSRAQRELESLR